MAERVAAGRAAVWPSHREVMHAHDANLARDPPAAARYRRTGPLEPAHSASMESASIATTASITDSNSRDTHRGRGQAATTSSPVTSLRN